MLDPLAGFYYIDLNDKKLKKVDLSLTRKALKNDKAIPDIHEFFIDSDFNKYFFMYEYDPSQISPAGYPFRTAFVKLNKNDKPVFIFDFNSYIRIDDIYLESMDKEKHIRPAIFDKDPHVNAAIIDSDGNYLLECRHASCIIKVDSKTGKVLWQLGGKRNQFKPIGDDFLWFAGQHSPILLKNGNIAIYDNQGVNGNKKSRMVIYKLDEANRTVRQVY